MSRRLYLLILLTSLLSCGREDTLTFSVMGDVPRQAWEDSLLQAQILAHNQASPAEFMLHVGDIKTGSAPCDEQVYAKVAGYLKALNVPVFIVPGDNEWNDCPDPQQAWSYWHQYFDDFEKNWDQAPTADHQEGHPENMAWISKNVLMIGINLVGGRVYNENVWQEMMTADINWISEQFHAQAKQVYAAVVFAQANPKAKHHWFMERFISQVKSFAKPVLYLHGDGHRWLYDKNWQAANLTRIQVDQGALAVPLEIQVSSQTDSTFAFNRKPFPMPQ
jgi:hypothetical protein